MKKDDWRAVIIVILSFQLLSIWLIDVRVPAIINNAINEVTDSKEYSFLTNGFIRHNPIVTYHVALIWLAISFVMMALITIHVIGGKRR